MMHQPGFFEKDQLRSVQMSPDFFGWNFCILSGCTRRNFGKILTNKKFFHIGEKSYPHQKKFFVVRPPAGTSKWLFNLEVPAGGLQPPIPGKKQWYIPQVELLAVHTTREQAKNVDLGWHHEYGLKVIVIKSPRKFLCMLPDSWSIIQASFMGVWQFFWARWVVEGWKVRFSQLW